MKEYCEDSLEKYETKKETNNDKETLVKMLNLSLLKVAETEEAKQINDLKQIEAQENFEKKLKETEDSEKNLKRNIEKVTEITIFSDDFIFIFYFN
jgi:hypothetical protein